MIMPVARTINSTTGSTGSGHAKEISTLWVSQIYKDYNSKLLQNTAAAEYSCCSIHTPGWVRHVNYPFAAMMVKEVGTKSEGPSPT